MHIIEINNFEGIAVVNTPIYFKNEIPLIPDFFDLNKRELYTDEFELETLRNQLINEINQTRQEYGLATIELSDELNILAQNHSDDMLNRDFFAHINPDSQSPEDRRIALGITSPVGENIAKDSSIKFAHEGLMRSAAHRNNILKPDWERIGIGITLNNGYLIISEEFSTNPPTNTDINSYKTILFEEINKKRTENNLPELLYSSDLENACINVNDLMINQGLELSNESFSEILNKNNISGSTQAIGRVFNLWNEILSSILTEELTIMDENWQYIGVDISLDSIGNLNTIVILNEQ